MTKDRGKSAENSKLTKEERLRAALRANLARRKQQARERSAQDDSQDGEQSEE